MSEPEKQYWLDEPRNVTKIVYGLVVLCGLLLLADLFYAKHPYFGFDGWFGFYPVYGFVGSVFLVLAAKQLRRLLKRDEDYYEDTAGSGERDVD